MADFFTRYAIHYKILWADFFLLGVFLFSYAFGVFLFSYVFDTYVVSG